MRYALLGLLAITLLWFAPKPEQPSQEVQTTRTVQVEPSKNIKKRTGETVKKKVTWRDNPNNCNTNTHWIAKEKPFKCIKKTPVTNVTGTSNTITNTGCNSVSKYTNWDTRVAYAVCMAESGGNSQAVNRNDNHGVCTGSFGLMQLACFHTANPLDPAENIKVANQIYSRSGWQPWGAYTSGAYLRYME